MIDYTYVCPINPLAVKYRDKQPCRIWPQPGLTQVCDYGNGDGKWYQYHYTGIFDAKYGYSLPLFFPSVPDDVQQLRHKLHRGDR